MKPHLFPPEKFPITVEFLHPVTRAVVDSVTIEAPVDGTFAHLHIPPVAKKVGHAVDVRIIFGDGEVVEE